MLRLCELEHVVLKTSSKKFERTGVKLRWYINTNKEFSVGSIIKLSHERGLFIVDDICGEFIEFKSIKSVFNDCCIPENVDDIFKLNMLKCRIVSVIYDKQSNKFVCSGDDIIKCYLDVSEYGRGELRRVHLTNTDGLFEIIGIDYKKIKSYDPGYKILYVDKYKTMHANSRCNYLDRIKKIQERRVSRK